MRVQGKTWWQIAGAGYLVLLVFTAGYFATEYLVEEAVTVTKITVGILLASPLAVAFLWDRVKRLKIFGLVEIELNDLEVPYVPSNPELEDAIAATQYYSGNEAIKRQISEAVKITDKQVFEINLRSNTYWWSTRLYLLTALLMDNSAVSHIVFVEGDDHRRFVGITRTELLRHAIARTLPCLETIYSKLKLQNLNTDSLVEQWAGEAFDGQGEIDAKSEISSQKLRTILGDGLEINAVESGGKLDSELYDPILDNGSKFVPLVKKGQLDRIIDANALARKLAHKAL